MSTVPPLAMRRFARSRDLSSGRSGLVSTTFAHSCQSASRFGFPNPSVACAADLGFPNTKVRRLLWHGTSKTTPNGGRLFRCRQKRARPTAPKFCVAADDWNAPPGSRISNAEDNGLKIVPAQGTRHRRCKHRGHTAPHRNHKGPTNLKQHTARPTPTHRRSPVRKRLGLRLGNRPL